MTYNGELPTSQGAIYTAPTGSIATPPATKTITWLRVVNNSAAARTFTLYLNLSGTGQPITPVSTQLPIGAAYGDDIPPLQIRPGCSIEGIADAAGVAWTINVE